MTNGVYQELETLIRARYPLIVMETYEEDRAQRILEKISEKRDKRLFCWSVTRGIHEHDAPIQSKRGSDQTTQDPLAALDTILNMLEPAIYILKDFHPYLNDASVIRKLRELAHSLKSSYKTVVFISPNFRIPMELDKEITMVDLPLPDLQELDELLTDTIREVNEKTDLNIDPDTIPKEQILKAALGLTLNEAENVFAKSLVMGGRLTADDIPVILSEKEQIIRKSGLLEYYPSNNRFNEVGGLDILKDWLTKRRLAFTEKAKQYGLPYPKGVLLLGVQGCGKSLCAKAVSALWQIPLLRFDVGKVFSSLIGSSEENIRKAIQAAESVSPAILWVDEIEKAFSGAASSGMSDGGTSARILGTFLTWLQEKKSPVFVIATANNITSLPPELLRKGRLDEIFFVDLPSDDERESIISIHLQKRNMPVDSIDLKLLAQKTDQFSGAELEQGIISAMFDSFQKEKPLDTNTLLQAFEETVPLATTMKEDIHSLRKWAAGRARIASSTTKDANFPKVRRHFEL